MKAIVSTLEILLTRKDARGLREISARKQPRREPTTSFCEESELYGRVEERDTIVEFLLSEELGGDRNRIGAVAIVGMGGIGKTALAKLIFNNESVRKAFDLRVWVSVSDEFYIRGVTSSILESVTQLSYSTSLDLTFLQNELRDKLRHKRFLLVLDDVWNVSYHTWQTLRAPFSVGAEGSKIIYTTRSVPVASVMAAVSIYQLTPLSDDDGWSLFCRTLSEAGSWIPNPTLESIGRKICTKCGGLPLAIKALAGLLRGTHGITEWEAILHSRLWDTPRQSNVMPSLWLSYCYLPPYLKRCFAYCAIFPKGYRIDRKQLVLLWMAQNFIVLTDHDRSMEEVGDDYVQQLLGRSFFELLDTSFLTMHDLMHDLAQFVSGYLIATHGIESPLHISERAQHFSYHPGVFDGIDKFQALHKAVHLRTFFQLRKIVGGTRYLDERYFLANTVMTVLISHLECLRVLSLSEYEIFELPESIGHLRQLRYLDVSRTKIRLLPGSLTCLHNLQTLLLRDCHRLKRLPANIGQLAFLRHVDIRGTTSLLEMPKEMGRLKNLQTLTAFVVGRNSGSDVKELRDLRHIHGNLALRRLQNVAAPSDVIDVNLSDWKCIDVLALEFDSVDDDEIEKSRQVQLLENLKPPANLEELVVRNYVGMRFPKWLEPGCAKYIGMTSLCLSGCLYCCFLPPLGQLPSLKLLKIEGMDHVVSVGHEFYGHNNSNTFQALESLSFGSMKGWEMWLTADAEGIPVLFPRLKKLSLHDCPILKGNLPIHTPLLEEVEVDRCDQLCRLLLQWPSMHTVEVASYVHAEFVNAFDVASLTILRLVGLAQLVKLPPELTRLSLLREFRIVSCENLRSLANVQLPPKLELLEIEQCKVLESFPDDLTSLPHLDHIALKQCPCLSWIPGINLPTSLHSLDVYNCERWEFPIQEKMQQCSSLERLRFTNTADNLICFPLGAFPNLNVLSFWGCKHIEKVYIPEGVVGQSLSSLNVLQIGFCPKLEMVGRQTGRGEATVLPAPNLTILQIRSCPKMKPLSVIKEKVFLPTLYFLAIDMIPSEWAPWRGVFGFVHLKILTVYGQHVEHFPDETLEFLRTSIAKLSIIDFPSLRQLNGRILQSLRSLKELWIEDCPQLQCLPKEGLPSSLGLLNLRGCPKLEERCRPEKGPDWSIIRRLPCVVINGFLVVPHTPGISVPWSPTQRIYQKSGLIEIDEDVLHYGGRQAAFKNAQSGSTSKSKGKMICEDEIGMETNPAASDDVELIQMIREDGIEMESNPPADNEVGLIQMSHDLESELRGVIEPKIPDAEQMLISHWDNLINPDTPASISIPDPRNPLAVSEAGPSDKTIREPEMTSASFGIERPTCLSIANTKGKMIHKSETEIESDPETEADNEVELMQMSEGLEAEPYRSIEPRSPGAVSESGPTLQTILKPEMISTSSESNVLVQRGEVKVAEQMQMSHGLQGGLESLSEPNTSVPISISGPSLGTSHEMSANLEMIATASEQTRTFIQSEVIREPSFQLEARQQSRILLPPRVDTHRPIRCTIDKIFKAVGDAQSGSICLHGRGGSGKTTVLKILFHHPASYIFDQVIFVTVPRLAHRRQIQNEIMQQLSFNMLDSYSEDEMAALICEALTRMKVLLLLDDVWKIINLHEIGIPNPGANNSCWLVLASRSLDVCRAMAVREIEMDVLSEVESWGLLCNQVGEVVDSPDIEPYAEAIAKECHGSPLIISAVASALRLKGSVMEWKFALWSFQMPDAYHADNLYYLSPQIKYCYHKLNSRDVKACFLYCAFFPRDKEIDISVLVDCIIAEGLLGGRTIAAYKRGHDIVGQLVNASLLEATENGGKVIMHNVIRDSALALLSSDLEGYQVLTRYYVRPSVVPLSKRDEVQSMKEGGAPSTLVDRPDGPNVLSPNIHKYLTRAGAQLREPPTLEEWAQAEIIFLMDNAVTSLPSKPSCPDLQALFLQGNSCLRVIPASFFDGMRALRILNFSKTRIKSLPDSFSKIKNLEVLALRDCERLLMLPSSIGHLKALQVLDLEGTELTDLPASVGELASLKHLRVSFYGSVNHSKCRDLPTKLIPDKTISVLDLRELGLFVHPGDQRWTSCASHIVEEISNLRLSSLYFHFPEVDHLEHFLNMNQSWINGDLAMFNFIVGHDFKHVISQVSYDAEMTHSGEERCMRFVNGENIPYAVLEVLLRTTSFYLDHHLNICFLSEFGIERMHFLKVCILRDCPKLLAIVDNDCATVVLPFLEYLSINYLWNLQRIWVNRLEMGSFTKLRHLSLHACPRLRYVFTCSMLDILSNLEELIIKDCASMEYIVIEDDHESNKLLDTPHVSRTSSMARVPVLQSLKVLKLHYLPELSAIWKDHWPPLEYISVYNCPKLKNLNLLANDAMSIKEIAAENIWWDSLDWEDLILSRRLQELVTQINIDDL